MADSGPSTSSPTMTTGSNDQQSSEELLKQFVSDALILKAQGDGTKLYDQLVGEVQRLKSLVSGPLAHQFDAESQANQKQLVALLRGVTRCLALVKEAHHEVLVTEIMDIKLWMVGSAVREAVLSFLCHAVAVNGAFIQGSLHVLVFSLVPMAVPVPAPAPVGETDAGAAEPLATSSASWMPSAARGSIGTPVTRWAWKWRRTTWAARAKAASTAAVSPKRVSTATLPGASSHSGAAPGASRASTTKGSTS